MINYLSDYLITRYLLVPKAPIEGETLEKTCISTFFFQDSRIIVCTESEKWRRFFDFMFTSRLFGLTNHFKPLHYKKITFQKSKHSQKGLNIPKKSKQNTLLWVAAPREGNPPGKHNFFRCIFTKKYDFSLQTAFFYGFNVFMSFLVENDAERFRNYFKNQIWTKNM